MAPTPKIASIAKTAKFDLERSIFSPLISSARVFTIELRSVGMPLRSGLAGGEGKPKIGSTDSKHSMTYRLT